MSGYLVMADGRRIEVRNGLTLGRVAQCDVVLKDTKASRRHARLVVEGSVVEVEDLGSSNGTFLNDKPVQRRLLRDGDQIRIGKTTVTFAEAGGVESAADEELEIDLESTDEPVIEPVIEPVLGPAGDPYRPGGGLEGDPLVGQRPPADDVEVLEFVDEVVTVKRREPAPPPVARPTARRTTGSKAREHGVLTFQKPTRKGGVLGDDMRQMSMLQRVVLAVAVLAAAAGLGWVVMKVAAGL
jgi:pSer/pThr/pTyr-binding forkhead associated (FHA) protein